jgi:hypothetical protein
MKKEQYGPESYRIGLVCKEEYRVHMRIAILSTGAVATVVALDKDGKSPRLRSNLDVLIVASDTLSHEVVGKCVAWAKEANRPLLHESSVTKIKDTLEEWLSAPDRPLPVSVPRKQRVIKQKKGPPIDATALQKAERNARADLVAEDNRFEWLPLEYIEMLKQDTCQRVGVDSSDVPQWVGIVNEMAGRLRSKENVEKSASMPPPCRTLSTGEPLRKRVFFLLSYTDGRYTGKEYAAWLAVDYSRIAYLLTVWRKSEGFLGKAYMPPLGYLLPVAFKANPACPYDKKTSSIAVEQAGSASLVEEVEDEEFPIDVLLRDVLGWMLSEGIESLTIKDSGVVTSKEKAAPSITWREE